MKKLQFLTAIVSMCLVATLAWAAPVIKAPQPEQYAGKVYEGQLVKGTFEIFNEGDQVLQIKSVKPG